MVKKNGYLVSKGDGKDDPFLRVSHMGDVKLDELKNIVRLIAEYAKNWDAKKNI